MGGTISDPTYATHTKLSIVMGRQRNEGVGEERTSVWKKWIIISNVYTFQYIEASKLPSESLRSTL